MEAASEALQLCHAHKVKGAYHAHCLIGLGAACKLSQKPPMALGYFVKAEEVLDNYRADGVKQLQIMNYRLLAESYIECEDYKQAVLTIDKILRLKVAEPIIIETLILRSTIAIIRQDHEETLKIALELTSKTAKDHRKPWHSAQLSLIQAYFDLRCPEKAYQHLSLLTQVLKDQRNQDIRRYVESALQLNEHIDQILAGKKDHQFGDKRICATCGAVRPDLQICSGCEWTNYCSVKCQKAAWPQHRIFCQEHRIQSANNGH